MVLRCEFPSDVAAGWYNLREGRATCYLLLAMRTGSRTRWAVLLFPTASNTLLTLVDGVGQAGPRTAAVGNMEII